jgi:hypothetical protein
MNHECWCPGGALQLWGTRQGMSHFTLFNLHSAVFWMDDSHYFGFH